MSSQSGSESELLKEISEQLRLSRREEQRKRVENLHVLVAIGIIGIYFTQPAQQIVSNLNIVEVTKLFVGGACLYLLIKITAAAFRSWKNIRIFSVMGEFIAPFLLLLVVYGYLITIFLSLVSISFDFDISVNIEVASLVLVSLIPIAIKYARQRFQEYMANKEKEEKLDERISGRQFEEFVYENPHLIETGLKWTDQETRYDIGVDLIGEDSEGTTVVAEVKTEIGLPVARHLTRAFDYLTLNYGRKLAITTKITEPAQSHLESNGWECVVIETK